MSRLLASLGFALLITSAIACAVDEPVTASEDPITDSDASTSEGGKVDAGKEEQDEVGANADAAPATPQIDCADSSFSKKVLPEIAKAGCAGVTCHGTRFGHDPRLEEKDAPLTYKALVAYKISGKPYVKTGGTDPNDSSIHCHLLGQCGTKMPPGGGKVPESMIKAIDSWLACGAANN